MRSNAHDILKINKVAGNELGTLIDSQAKTTLCNKTTVFDGNAFFVILTGFSMWPALIIDEAHAGALRSPKPYLKERTVPVQFFGTYDFARYVFLHYCLDVFIAFQNNLLHYRFTFPTRLLHLLSV